MTREEEMPAAVETVLRKILTLIHEGEGMTTEAIVMGLRAQGYEGANAKDVKFFCDFLRAHGLLEHLPTQ